MRDIRNESGYQLIFDGRSLTGWRSIPRIYGYQYPGGPHVHEKFRRLGVPEPLHPERHPAAWNVEPGGVLVGRQSVPGYGGYLLSEHTFGEFDLALEMRPDWPADTGVMLRRRGDDWSGFQVLVDHRQSGSIGGFFGNGLGSFSAVPFAVDVARDESGAPVGLVADDPLSSREPVTPDKTTRLAHAASVEDFLSAWRWDDWNELRARCVGGALPRLTTWINGLKIAHLDTATLEAPNYDAARVAAHLGARGHIAFEVHDNDALFGESRWGARAACRWRNIRIREHTPAHGSVR